MNAFRTILLVGVCGAMLLGCRKEEGTAPTTPAQGEETAGGVKMGEEAGAALGDAAGKVGQETKQALEAFRDVCDKQLDVHGSKLESLKTGAKAFSDEKLTGLIGNLDEKLAAARAKLANLSGAEVGAAAAMKQELTALMNEIPKLLEQATARFEELKGDSVTGLPAGNDVPDMPGR